jgi:hypothetical protein
MELKCGMIVKSVAGHDKNRFYLVIKIEKGKKSSFGICEQEIGKGTKKKY